MSLLEEPQDLTAVVVEVGERDLRGTLRGQIAHLERELIAAATSARPMLEVPRARSHAGPRILDAADLERIRDELAGKLSDVRAARHTIVERQTERRNRLERMLLEPGKYKFEVITNADIGEEGLQGLPQPPAAGRHRHAGGLVARQGLLRLSVSLGAVAAATAP